jgi:hypothetical protein
MKNMKTLIFISLLAVGFLQAWSQTEGGYGNGYTTRVERMNGQSEVVGKLLETGDTTIALRTVKSVADTPLVYLNMYMPVSQIQTIYISRRTTIGRGMWMGGLIGFGTGALIGLMSGGHKCKPGEWCFYPTTPGETALAIGTLLTIPGMLIGAVSRGNRSFKFTIDGNKENYRRQRWDIMSYSQVY